LSNATDQSSFHFEFNISRDEDRFFRALVNKRLRAHVDRRGLGIIALIGYAVAGVVSWIGVDQGWLTPRTLFALIVCVVLGQLYMIFVTTWSARRVVDKVYEIDRIAQMTWRVALDDLSIIARTPNVESRVSWDTIAEVEDSQVMVVMWYNARQGFFIPARVFADAAARAAFAKWASERLRSAIASPSLVRST
jgi:hypothetical protein